jgi:rRNA maturation endonuclease Nob1
MAIAYREDIEYDPSEYEQCIACGAHDVPDPRGRCKYCGARLPCG